MNSTVLDTGIAIEKLDIKARYCGQPNTYKTLTINDTTDKPGADVTMNCLEIFNVYRFEAEGDIWFGLKQQISNAGCENDYVVLAAKDYNSYIESGVIEQISLT